jgi:hypothetical protein
MCNLDDPIVLDDDDDNDDDYDHDSDSSQTDRQRQQSQYPGMVQRSSPKYKDEVGLRTVLVLGPYQSQDLIVLGHYQS